MDIENLSVSELEDILVRATSERDRRRNEMRGEVMAKIRELAASIGIDVVIPGDRPQRTAGSSMLKGTKVPAKYSDGNGNSWSGRGQTPRWMKEKLEAGATKEQFSV